MLGYKPISSAFRKTDAKIKALIRSAFLPHERGQEDPTEETEASAPAEPRWSPDQIETPVAAAIAVAVVAQDPIQPTVDSSGENSTSVPNDIEAGHANPKTLALDPALIAAGASAARRLFGKSIASPAEMAAFEAGATAAKRLLAGVVGGDTELHEYENGRMAAKRLLGQVVAPDAETLKFEQGRIAAERLLGKTNILETGV